MSKVYVILVNYNGWEDTIECLESLLTNDYENYQIIVVDNNSPDNSMEMMLAWRDEREERSGIIFIQSDKNGGFAAGNNIGIHYALEKDDFEFIWLLNNDTVIEKSALSSLVAYAREHGIGICGSMLMYYDNPTTIQACGGHINRFFGTSKAIVAMDEIDKRLDYIVGASFLIHKKVIESIGLLPEEYFLYYEECDYCFHARKKGFTLGIDANSIVYHKEGASTGAAARGGSDFSDALSLRNRVVFHQKYLGGGAGLRIGLLISLFNRLRRGKFTMSALILQLLFQKKRYHV